MADDDPTTTALDRLLEVTLLLGDDMRHHLAAQGLTESRAHLLYVLHDGGPTTQRHLAEALAVAPRTVTGLVDGLTDAGLVTREPHPTDRRATLVTPTERGTDVAAAFVTGRRELAGQLFAAWPTAAVAGFVGGLDTVLVTLRALVAADGEGS